VDRYYRAATTGSFNGDVATVTAQGWFPLQPRDRRGSMTRTNPKMRSFPVFHENVSLAKTFTLSKERRSAMDFRFEGFNVLNPTDPCYFETVCTIIGFRG